jgi:hypothetical protein
MSDSPYFDLPLNIPHAATIADRIVKYLAGLDTVRPKTRQLAAHLAAELMVFRGADDNPPEPEAEEVRQLCLGLGRDLVDRIENEGLARDKLGQHIRNLFECLAEGREGALISLRAGENPDSPQRPWTKPQPYSD